MVAVEMRAMRLYTLVRWSGISSPLGQQYLYGYSMCT